MAYPWYLFMAYWLPQDKQDIDINVFQPLPVVSHIDRTKVLDGARCAGIIYAISSQAKENSEESFITRAEIQHLNLHFWSLVVQSSFQRVPIAIIVPNKQEWIQLLPKILSTQRLDTIQVFASPQDAAAWLKLKHEAVVKDSNQWPPVTFSSIQ